LAPPAGKDLPEFYGEPRVTLLTVNSYLVHVYWDIDPSAIPAPNPPAMLRFHDVTQESPGSDFDVAVDLPAKNWYVNLWSPARSYYLELGWNDEKGFHPLARSNTVETPRAWPVTQVEPARETAESPSPALATEETHVLPAAPPPGAWKVGAPPPVDAAETLQRRRGE